ncbi:MAG TPA: CHAP domain-containing protein [Candidatus Angelobacter sp.]|nr:CHAP domain-containing protein [Candidatus Angelobacter sp.]
MFLRRIIIEGILAIFLLAGLCVPATPQTVQEDRRVRLVSPEEGEMILQAAWKLRRGLHPKPDCSHFVHAIYSQAGFDYEYASASDVYDGIDSFRRVLRPQSGDLVVWRGHVGIVVAPDEHSFYSSVLSGFAIEDYDSDYWTSRGRPRFYRYVANYRQTIPALNQASAAGKQARAQPTNSPMAKPPARPQLLP